MGAVSRSTFGSQIDISLKIVDISKPQPYFSGSHISGYSAKVK